MPAWLSDADLLQAVADVLQVKDVAALAEFWDRRVADANRAAVQDIAGRLAARGYSPAQVQGWDRGREYNRHLGLYFALLDGGAAYSLLPEQVKLYDRRKELDAVAVTVAGAVAQPAGGGGAAGGQGVAGGRLSDAGYRFTTATEF
jgi:hypothetical protein